MSASGAPMSAISLYARKGAEFDARVANALAVLAFTTRRGAR